MSNPIPDAALAQHIAILGKTGSGKTYAAKGVVEGILSAGGRVCVIDPTGAWHGLRSSATGKSAGFPVVIFGGEHADLPLGGAHGEALAEIIGTAATPAVIDTSSLKTKERVQFFTDFADGILRKNRGPLHLVIDEAHLFAPQGKTMGAAGDMLTAANNMVSLGRSRGLRIILITQRPAKLHKDSLTQVETLVALRLIAPQDRGAVEEWIKDNADQVKGREIISSLATLKTGEGWVWAPEIGVLDRVRFPKIKTFDTSRAPEEGEDGKGPVLAPIDKDAIQGRLEAVAADAVANDPARLKAEIAKLKRDLAVKPSVPAADPQAAQQAYIRGKIDGYADAIKGVTAEFKVTIDALDEVERKFSAVRGAAAQVKEWAKRPAPTPPAPRHVPAARHAPPPRPRTNGHAKADAALPVGERAVLIAAAQYEGVDRDQLSVLTGYKRSSRDAYIQRLREKGYIEVSGQTVTPTDAGRDALGSDYAPLPTGPDLQAYWQQRLPEGERKILSELIAAYPNALPRSDLDDATGYKRSSRDAYIQRLKSRRLVETRGSEVAASETLFA